MNNRRFVNSVIKRIDKVQSSHGNSNTQNLAHELKSQWWRDCFKFTGSEKFKLKTFHEICVSTEEQLCLELSILKTHQEPFHRRYKIRKGSISDRLKSPHEGWEEIKRAKYMERKEKHQVLDTEYEVVTKIRVLEQKIEFVKKLNSVIEKTLTPKQPSFVECLRMRDVKIGGLSGLWGSAGSIIAVSVLGGLGLTPIGLATLCLCGIVAFSLAGLPIGASIRWCANKISGSKKTPATPEPQNQQPPEPKIIEVKKPQPPQLKRSNSDSVLVYSAKRRLLNFLNQSNAPVELPAPAQAEEKPGLTRRRTL